MPRGSKARVRASFLDPHRFPFPTSVSPRQVTDAGALELASKCTKLGAVAFHTAQISEECEARMKELRPGLRILKLG